MKIIPLNEGAFAVDKKKNFITATDVLAPGSLKMAVCPFLIVLKDDILLLDAGLGENLNGIPTIKTLLQEHGYDASQVTKVLLSHLHKDHISGLGIFENGDFLPAFPKAKIYLQKRELDYALRQTENPSFNQEVLKALASLPNIELLSEEEGWISDAVSFEVTGGHSPFHQAFWVREEGTMAFYGADNLPQKAYLRFHMAYKSDDDGKKAMALREKWETLAKNEHWTVLFYHDLTDNVVQF